MIKLKIQCKICKSDSISEFYFRKNVQIYENLVFPSKEEATSIQKGTISSVICNECGFVFNKNFVECFMKYGDGYENSQNSSSFFQKHIFDLINRLVYKHQIQNSTILEIGCGDGYFLSKFTENDSWKNYGIGYDPSFKSKNKLKNFRIEKKFFDETCNETPDIIISRHTIEHIFDPIHFLTTIKKITKSKTRVFIETPSFEWIVKNQSFWDMTYEHCSFFSKNSLERALQITGFDVISIENIFNGQYLWAEAIPSKNKASIKNSRIDQNYLDLCNKLQETEYKMVSKVKEAFKPNELAIWGAAGKGVSFANIVDPECNFVKFLIDSNPKKWGKFISGTSHKIINPSELKKYNIKTVIIMNPNYFSEISEFLKNENIELNLINLHEFLNLI